MLREVSVKEWPQRLTQEVTGDDIEGKAISWMSLELATAMGEWRSVPQIS